MPAVFFNLLANSTLSILSGLLIVGVFILIFRIPTGPMKLFLLSLPFIKVVFDVLRGVPANSILHTAIDPFALPPRHQFIDAGLAFNSWGPSLMITLSIQDLQGNIYAASLGDYMMIWFYRQMGAQWNLLVLACVIAISTALLLRRISNFVSFERQRRRDRQNASQSWLQIVGFRKVDVYVSPTLTGSPFTGGILRPFICLPQSAAQTLSTAELEAVIAHEMAHIRQWDMLGTILVQILGDVFWFVPGYRWLSRKIDRLREIVADQWVMRSGINPTLLASSLVKLSEATWDAPAAHYSAFFRERSLLQIRVQRLLGDIQDKQPRFGWSNLWVRSVVTVWTITAVLVGTIGGNHPTTRFNNPDWLNTVVRALGF
jgi:beta-lactamase regulating signal transducer with metallopeptidase domain